MSTILKALRRLEEDGPTAGGGSPRGETPAGTTGTDAPGAARPDATLSDPSDSLGSAFGAAASGSAARSESSTHAPKATAELRDRILAEESATRAVSLDRGVDPALARIRLAVGLVVVAVLLVGGVGLYTVLPRFRDSTRTPPVSSSSAEAAAAEARPTRTAMDPSSAKSPGPSLSSAASAPSPSEEPDPSRIPGARTRSGRIALADVVTPDSPVRSPSAVDVRPSDAALREVPIPPAGAEETALARRSRANPAIMKARGTAGDTSNPDANVEPKREQNLRPKRASDPRPVLAGVAPKPVALRPRPPAPESPQSARPHPRPTEDRTHLANVSAPAPDSVPPVRTRPRPPAPAAPAASAPGPATDPPASSSPPDVPSVERIDHRGLPDVTVVGTAWHPSAERRSARIRLESSRETLTLHEGDAVGGLVIQKISPSAVLFRSGEVEIRRRVGQPSRGE